MHSKNFLIYYLPSSSLKVSPIVSKRVSKKAVIRNKIKRRVRAIFYGVEKGFFAVVVKNDISNLNFELLKNEIKKSINKIC